MKNIIDYKGYQAKIEFSAEDATLFGVVMDINDKIIFEIDNPEKAMDIFEEVIEDYLELCLENGKEPCKPYKGVFNVRISPELHKKAVILSRKKNMTLNSFVELAIKKQVNSQQQSQIINIYLNNTLEKVKYSNNLGKDTSLFNCTPKFSNKNIHYRKEELTCIN